MLTRRVCELPLLPIMANSKDGQGHNQLNQSVEISCHKKCSYEMSKLLTS